MIEVSKEVFTLDKESISKAYVLFEKAVSKEEDSIKDWIGRSGRGPAKLLIH